MKSSLYIKDLALEAYVGAYEHEKIAKQPILVDIIIAVDQVLSDHLKDTIDYTKVAELCHQVVEREHYHLIETLASVLIRRLTAQFHVKGIRVILKKPRALARAEYVAVIMDEGEVSCHGL